MFEWRSVPLDGLATYVTHRLQNNTALPVMLLRNLDSRALSLSLSLSLSFYLSIYLSIYLSLACVCLCAPRILEEDTSLAAEADLLKTIADPEATCVNRNRAAYEVVWLRRSRPSGWTSNPLLASSLTLNDAVMLYDSVSHLCSSSLGVISAPGGAHALERGPSQKWQCDMVVLHMLAHAGAYQEKCLSNTNYMRSRSGRVHLLQWLRTLITACGTYQRHQSIRKVVTRVG